MLDKHGIDNGASGDSGRSFEPTLETAGDDGLAPPAFSRLRLADDLDTYVDRVQVDERVGVFARALLVALRDSFFVGFLLHRTYIV